MADKRRVILVHSTSLKGPRFEDRDAEPNMTVLDQMRGRHDCVN